VQEAFMDDAGCDVVVATVAFGMGVDKPNVRWVFHESVSDSVDSHYQELGRAGRDGEPARARLFYRSEDLGVRRFFAGGAIDPEALDRIADVLADARRPVEPGELLDKTDLSQTKLATALHRLQDTGAVELEEDGTAKAVASKKRLHEAAEEAAQAEEERLAFDRSRIEMMRAYAEHDSCRRAFILGYFGEEFEPPCGNCDNCDAGLTAPASAEGALFPTGTRVRHGQWGEGTVGQVEDDQLTVVFDTVGYKTLDAALVRERGLLEPLG
jgi:ATP-dependent DNA helicase RecQ